MAHLALPLLEGCSKAPLLDSRPLSPMPGAPSLPPHQVMVAACPALRAWARKLLLSDWAAAAPPPPYYSFPLQLTPHPFMGLGKFVAGRLHEMRSQKSYLAGHHDWGHDPLPHCPQCGGEPETSDHAILASPSTAYL